MNILYPDRLDNVEAIRCCVQIFESFHFSQINGFFKGEFFRLQDVTLFEKLVSILKSFYNVRVDFIGSPGSSCLADDKKVMKWVHF